MLQVPTVSAIDNFPSPSMTRVEGCLTVFMLLTERTRPWSTAQGCLPGGPSLLTTKHFWKSVPQQKAMSHRIESFTAGTGFLGFPAGSGFACLPAGQNAGIILNLSTTLANQLSFVNERLSAQRPRCRRSCFSRRHPGPDGHASIPNTGTSSAMQ